MQELWQGWIEAWRGMEAHARRRGWKVTPLEIAPPASEQRVAALEAAHGLKVPGQLRILLTGWSSGIQFGWCIPSNAPWDNRTTMLMRSGPETARRLLLAGADPHQTDYNGASALHHADTAELVRLLVQHGADVNALSRPPADSTTALLETPLQSAMNPYRQADGVAAALLELGADPRIPDSRGLNALFYCCRVEDVELLRRHGLSLDQRTPDGGTLLHHLCTYCQGAVARDERTVALIRYFVDNGVDINAGDNDGQTVLHLIARGEYGGDDDVALMLELGADKSVKDKKGRRPSAVVPRSKAALRAALT